MDKKEVLKMELYQPTVCPKRYQWLIRHGDKVVATAGGFFDDAEQARGDGHAFLKLIGMKVDDDSVLFRPAGSLR